MTMPPLEEQFRELNRAVARSRATVAAGDCVNLSGLDAEIARATELARNAPAPQRSALLAALSALLGELDGLAVDLQRQHDAALAQQAASAYARDRA
ncbi:MAG: hypothetical protein ACREFL_07740 [Stellaceae bacterium]